MGVGIALLAAAPVLLPAAALAQQAPLMAPKPKKQRLVLEERASSSPLTAISATPALDSGRFSFTAPGGAGAVASPRVSTLERGFRFTPSGKSERRAFSVGVTSRVIAQNTAATGPAPARAAAAAPVEAALLPAGYNVDLSVGWLGFALSGGVSRLDPGLGYARREGVDVGLSYRANRWRTSVLALAERGGPMRPDVANERRYSFEVGGAYALSPGLSVTGGVRYRLAPPIATPLEPNRDDGAVYVGTSVAF